LVFIPPDATAIPGHDPVREVASSGGIRQKLPDCPVRLDSKKLSCRLTNLADHRIMRAPTPLALLLCSLLAACTTSLDALINREIEQSGPLKVHPGLVEKPGPARATAVAVPSPASAAATEDASTTPVEEAPADSR
jgi:hypothetical protein